MSAAPKPGFAQDSQASAPHLAQRWLDAFERALNAGDAAAIAALFDDDSHWRDLLAFTWHINTRSGAKTLANALVAAQPATAAHNFRLATDRTPPRHVRRVGEPVLETIFDFRTRHGRGSGVLRIKNDPAHDGEAVPRAWVLLTALQALDGTQQRVADQRARGEAYSRNFGGENWLDQRLRLQRYEDREPTCLIIGGGQAGLSLAARLGQLGVDALIVDRYERVGDNWRKRYHSLALHNETHVNHLPYLPFPPTFPRYLPKDMLANWFEFYADAMEINYWTGTEFVRGSYDEANQVWSAVVRRGDGTERTLHPRHVVFANGVSGIPKIPQLPGLDDFAGEVVHSHRYREGSKWKNKNVLVLGTGNSGHDVAQDLHSHGANTRIIQRGSTTVVSIEPSARMNYALYNEGPPIEDCDLLNTATAYPLVVRGYQLAVEKMVEHDRTLIDGLIARGFKYDLGHDQTGHQMKYQRRGGGYYLDAGCSGLIINGEVGLLQFDDIERFVADGALMKNGSTVAADLLILATGFHTQRELVRRLLGEAVADRVGDVWGWGEDGEMRNMWKRTAQPGLWFIAGSLTQCRIYSKYLALQIKAHEDGLLVPLAEPTP